MQVGEAVARRCQLPHQDHHQDHRGEQGHPPGRVGGLPEEEVDPREELQTDGEGEEQGDGNQQPGQRPVGQRVEDEGDGGHGGHRLQALDAQGGGIGHQVLSGPR